MVHFLHQTSKTTIFMIAFLGLFFVPGCLHKNKAKRESSSYRYERQEQGVHVAVEMMTERQMKEAFGVNFLKYGYVPISLTVNNTTADALLLRGQSIHLPLQNPYAVAQSAHYSTALLTSYSAYLSCLLFWPALLPSLGGGYYMAQTNAAITQSVCSQGLAGDGSVDILPYEQVSRVLFVPVNAFNTHFRMHLFNVHEKSFIPFTVALGAMSAPSGANDALLAVVA